MKKIIYIFLAFIFVTACTKDENTTQPEMNGEYPVTITALSNDTKTNAIDGSYNIKWTQYDAISVTVTGKQYNRRFSTATSGMVVPFSGTFTESPVVASGDNVFIQYPFGGTQGTSQSSYNLPQVQSSTKLSEFFITNTTIADDVTNLTFTVAPADRAFTIIRFKLYKGDVLTDATYGTEKIKRVIIKGTNSSDVLCGDFTCALATPPAPTFTTNTSNEVDLSVETADQKTISDIISGDVYYYAVVNATTLANGYSVIVETDNYALSYKLSTSSTFTAGTTKEIKLAIKDSKFMEQYGTGFESAEGFVATSSYQNTSSVAFGPAGKQWKTIHGAVSTTSAISGSQSMQMRYYGDLELGQTYTDFILNNATAVTFIAKNANDMKVRVQHMEGGVWVTGQVFDLTPTAASYTYNISSTGINTPIAFTFIPKTETTENSRLYIDDVVVTRATGSVGQSTSTGTITPPDLYVFENISADPESLSWAGDETDAKTVTVTSSGAWTATIDNTADFTLSATSGVNGGTFTVTPTGTNDGSSAKTAIVTLTLGTATATVTCSQASASAMTGIPATWDFNAATLSGGLINATSGNTNATISAVGVSDLSIGGSGTKYATATAWTISSYWLVTIPVTNFAANTTVNLAYEQRSSNTGPKNFVSEYSTDGGITWTESGTVTPMSGTATIQEDVDVLVANAISSGNLLIRIRVSNTDNSKGNGTIAATGTNRLSGSFAVTIN